MKKNIFVSLLFAPLLTFAADQIPDQAFLNLNDETVNAGLTINLDKLNLGTNQNINLAAEILNSDDFSTVSVGLESNHRFEGFDLAYLSLGINYLGQFNQGEEDGHFVPLSVKGRYHFPPLMYNIPPVSIDAQIMYAPQVLSFSNGERFISTSIEGNMEIVKDTKIYAGYRDIQSSLIEDYSKNGAYFGLKINY